MARKFIKRAEKKGVKTPFFIIFQGRSGSSYLQGLLDTHLDISCKGEIFDLDKEKLLNKELERDPKYKGVSTRKVLENIFSQPVMASGFKFKYLEQVELYPEVWQYLFERRDKIKVILLSRINLIKTAISLQNRVRLTNEGRDPNIRKDSGFYIGKLNLDIKLAIRYIKRRKERDCELNKLVEDFKYVLKINYEDLLYKRDETLKKVLEFLEVSVYLDLKEYTRKITPDDIKEAVENYDDLVEALKGTEFEKYLHD